MAVSNEIYQAGAALATGLAHQLVLKKIAQAKNLSMIDMIMALGAGAVAYSTAMSSSGQTRAIAQGVLDGAAAYVGTRLAGAKLFGGQVAPASVVSYPAPVGQVDMFPLQNGTIEELPELEL